MSSQDYREKIDSVMGRIKYGWVDKDGVKHTEMQGFSDNYRLQLPGELLESRLGVCWDQVELERKLFADYSIKATPFFIVYYDEKKCPTHTFMLLEEDGKVIWYEHAWANHVGWHEFDTLADAMREIRRTFVKEEKLENINPMNLVIYMNYPAPDKKLSCLEFYHHCEDKKNPRFRQEVL
jgi:hypothetical protein